MYQCSFLFYFFNQRSCDTLTIITSILEKEEGMIGWTSGNSLWQLVAQSDAMSAFILLLLLALSIVCWAVFLFKIITLRLKIRQLRMVHMAMVNVRSVEQLLAIATTYAGTLPGYYISKILVFLKTVLESNNGELGNGLQDHECEMVQHTIEQSVASIVEQEESYVSLLSTSAAISPLLGLLGTVWGLVHAFMNISEQQSADITTVAPGIAEALITTFAGLLVAIPALVMYNIVQRYIRSVESNLIDLADHVTFVIQRMVKR